MKILSDRLLRIKNCAEHSSCTCIIPGIKIDLHALPMNNSITQKRAAQKMSSKKDGCLRQPACFL